MTGSAKKQKVCELAIKMFGEGMIRKSINPDGTVAHGATFQAALLLRTYQEDCLDIVEKDQLKMSLCIRMSNGETHRRLRRA